MLNLDEIITEKLENILDEAKKLLPDKEIKIVEMDDPKYLKISEGASVDTYHDGRVIIYLDPNRADEHAIAHEIMHVKLRREGWPRIYSLIPQNEFTKDLATSVENLMDHYIFNSEFKKNGIDPTKYREKYVSSFEEWTRTENNVLEVLNNAILICEGMLFGENYRNITIESLGNRYSDSIELAIELENKIVSTKKSKKDIRKSLIRLLDFLNVWVQKENGEVPNLHRIIGISPLFTEEQLSKKATKYVKFRSERIINLNNVHMSYFYLKSDKSRFKSYISMNENEPDEIFEIRRLWQTQNLKTLLKHENINYGLIQ